MPSPLANLDGNAVLLVSGPATSYNSGQQQNIDVALGKPVLEALADLANAFHIRKSALTDANGRYAYQLRGPDSTVLSFDLTWSQQGVQEGDWVILEDA